MSRHPLDGTSLSSDADIEKAVAEVHERYGEMKRQLSQVIVGMDDVTEQLMIAVLCRGHCILQGMPGLAKTLLISQLASLMELSFHRIQFTPDLMPADITGGEIMEEDKATGHREFRFVKGPVFANLVLADEINRTPPKTQSALLEAMEERQLSVSGQTYKLPDPFFVLATQNPVEVEGTYPLPEAQLDRFLFKIKVSYPTRDGEQKSAAVRQLTTGRTSNRCSTQRWSNGCSPSCVKSSSGIMCMTRPSTWPATRVRRKANFRPIWRTWFNGEPARVRASHC
ncbi:MAG: AAA family ATPase [Planctomycetaceae bacterium]